MKITVAPAKPNNAADMAEILNEIIAVGGTTAYLSPISEKTIAAWIIEDGARCTWLVAFDETQRMVGFQWTRPSDALPKGATNIASFVRIGVVGGGIGSQLFAKTAELARDLGYEWINATIRSDNQSGLSFYSKMGFEDWKSEPDARLSDGRISGKTHKRYQL